MNINLIENINDFSAIAKDWDILYNSNDSSFFQSFSFNYYSWKHILSNNSRNKLSLILIQEDKEIVSIMPFYISNKAIRFINDIHSDFCDILLKEGFKINISEVIKFLRSNFSIKYIKLINLKVDSIVKKELDHYRSLYSYLDFSYSFSYFPLKKGIFPDNSNLPSKQRYNIKKILQKNLGDYQILSNPFNSFPKNRIISLRNKMISLKYRDHKFLDSNWLIFLERLYTSNLVDISVVTKNQNVHAISFIMKKDKIFMFWIDLFDDIPRINIYNYIKYIMSLSYNKDNIEIHLGRGIYPYKVRNFKPQYRNLFEGYIYFDFLSYYLFLIRKKILKLLIQFYKGKNR